MGTALSLCSEGDWMLELSSRVAGSQALSQVLATNLQAWAQVSRRRVAGSSAPEEVTGMVRRRRRAVT